VTGPTPMHPMPGAQAVGQGPSGTQGMRAMPYAQAESLVPSGGAAPKSSVVLYLGIAFGTLLLIGLAAIGAVLVLGKKDVATAGADAAALAATASVVPSTTPVPAPEPPPAVTSAPPPPEPPPVEPAPAKEPTPTPTKEPPPTPTPTPTREPTPTPTPATTREVVTVKDAGDPNAFNEAAARQRLAGFNSLLVFCKKEGGVTGPGMATVTFAPEGTVSTVSLDPSYAGTAAGECVSGYFKRAKVNPFQGAPRAVTHAFEVPAK
jgi:hypothetical protein